MNEFYCTEHPGDLIEGRGILLGRRDIDPYHVEYLCSLLRNGEKWYHQIVVFYESNGRASICEGNHRFLAEIAGRAGT